MALAPDDQTERDDVVEQAMPKKARQARVVPGIRIPSSLTSAFRINAASPTRSDTIVSGGNVLTRTPAKKNEPPHNTDSISRASHSLPFIR